MKKSIFSMLLGCLFLVITSFPTKATTIEDQVIYDENNIRITATGLNMNGDYGPEIKLLIENNTDENIIVQVKDSSINGCMIRLYMSANVSAGKKINDVLGVYQNYLDTSGIEEFSSIEVSFHVANDSYETLFDTPVKEIRTDLTEHVQTYDDSGDTVYDEAGIKIVSKGISNSDTGNISLILYIENNTDDYIGVQANNTSVNGFMVDPMMSSTIFPHEIIFGSMEFWADDIKENNITDIEEIETSFHFFDPVTYQTVSDTEALKIQLSSDSVFES